MGLLGLYYYMQPCPRGLSAFAKPWAALGSTGENFIKRINPASKRIRHGLDTQQLTNNVDIADTLTGVDLGFDLMSFVQTAFPFPLRCIEEKLVKKITHEVNFAARMHKHPGDFSEDIVPITVISRVGAAEDCHRRKQTCLSDQPFGADVWDVVSIL